jgi:hypothetical protein
VRPRINVANLKGVRPWEYVLRFVFGGLVTALAGGVTHAWGPSVGGLFLAFPSILPATLTLVKEHDGRAKAADDARGGLLGSVGLVLFAVIVAASGAHAPVWIVLGVATLAWMGLGVVLWSATLGRASRGDFRRS